MNNIVIAKEILRLAKEIMATDKPDGTAKWNADGKEEGEGTLTEFIGVPRKEVTDGTTEESSNTESTVSSSPGQKLRNAVYDSIVNGSSFPEELKDKEDEIREFVYDLTPNDKVKGFDSDKGISTSSLLFLVHSGELVINFGTVDGDFSCSNSDLKSLHGCPNKVKGYFDCSYNQLTSLYGCPNKVNGSFYCSNNQLTSLTGCPSEVKCFYCPNNQLTSLYGCPNEVKGSFSCSNNQLTSLTGCPKEVKGSFSCANNKLTLLEGCPNKVKGGFYCFVNRLTSLTGCPNKVTGDFYCNDNNLTSLTECPSKVKGNFYCYGNNISEEEFKKNHPNKIGGEIHVDDDLVKTAKQIYPNNNVI